MNENYIQSIIQNSNGVFKTYGGYSKSKTIETPHFQAVTSEIPIPVFNQILDAQLDPSNLKESIAEIMAPFIEKNIVIIWKVWPSSQPDDLGEHLVEFGFQQWGNAPGMLADLSQFSETLPAIDGLRIERVLNDKQLKDWVIPLEESNEILRSRGHYFYEMFQEFGYSPENPLQNYTGYLDDQPVTCGTLFIDQDNIAGIWNVGTIEKARRMGIGTAITQKMCLDASKRGCTYSTLVSSSQGLKVYQRLGYKEYCRVGYYGWLPEHMKSS